MAKCIDPCTSGLSSLHIENSVLNYKMMKPLDEVLRCRICFNYFDNCMMTKCSHNYCSLCIRKYMTYKSQCPTCFQDASEPELRNNRLVDEILRLYKKLKGLDGESSTCQSTIADRTVEVEDSTCESSQSSSQTFSQSSSFAEPSTPRIKIEIPDAVETSKDYSHVVVKSDPDFNEVTCPVCYKAVLGDKINSHLDICLKQQFNEDSERKTLPKLVYHLLSEKEIKSRLREHGLSVIGDKKTLIRRHKNFITLYNANCDSLNPKPASELVKEIEIQEIEEKINSLPKQIQVHKYSDQSLIRQQHESYVRKHQSQFSALISDVQQRQIRHMKIKQEQDSLIESYDHQDNKTLQFVDKDNELNLSGVEEHSNMSTETSKNFDETDSSSSSEDAEMNKPSISLHRKRKKATVSIKNQESPKKK